MKTRILIALIFLGGSVARAQLSGSLSTPAAQATWSTDILTGVITVTYTINNPAGQQGGVELYKVSPYVSIYRNTPIVNGTINTTLETGQAYILNVKTLTTGGSVVSSLNANMTYGGAPDKQVRITLSNPSATHDMKYKIFQDGDEVDEVTVPKATSMTVTVTVPSSSEVTVYAYVDGVSRDGPSWVLDPGAVEELGQVFQDGMDPDVTPTIDGTTPPTKVYHPPSPMPPDNLPAPDGNTSIWDRDTDANQSDLLTNPTFRQGVDNINRTIKEQAQAIGTKLDAVKTAVDGVKDAITDLPAGAGDAPEDAPSEAEDVPAMPATTVGDTAKGFLPTVPTFTAPGTGTHTFALAMRIPGIGETFDVNVDLADYDAGINIFKAMVRASLAVAFFFAVVREIRSAFAG